MPDPGEDYQRWSTVADANGTIDPLIDWHEGQTRRSVNNSSRSELAAHAKNRTLNNGSIVTTGSVNAQAFLSGVNYLTLPAGLRATLKVGSGLTNDGPLTLNCDGTGAVTVKKPTGSASLIDTAGGEFVTDHYVDLIFDGANWVYLYSAGSFAPINSPVFTGDPQAPTAPPNDSDNSIATTRFVMETIYGGEGIVLAQQVFATPGTFTYTPHSAMKSCIIECIGGGGGGGAAWTGGAASTLFTGGGGGSGGYSRKHATGTQIGASQPVKIGAGGAGGTPSGPGAGGNGGVTSVGATGSELCKANGGSGAQPGWISQMPHGGEGAAAGTGDVKIAGSPGENGNYTSVPYTEVQYPGNGAPGPLGGGARVVLAATGSNAVGYGSGGAGGSATTTDNGSSPIGGGNGAGGIVIITEFAGPGQPGPAGPQGPIGPTGPAGPAGAGSGDVLKSGSPTAGQWAQWTDATHVGGVTTPPAPPAPQSTVYTSGTGTYTTPAGTVWLEVQLVGGGAGGTGGNAATAANMGKIGVASTFGALTGSPGQPPTLANYSNGGVGGAAAGGDANIAGGGGGAGGGTNPAVTALAASGGHGASSFFGGGGTSAYTAAGGAAAANSGGGGGGGGVANPPTSAVGGGGGGAGGYVRKIIATPAATYAYAVGTGGAAGTAGTSSFAGGAGGSGIIIVVAHFGG